MKLLLALFGAVIGVLVVRGFLLAPTEEVAWRLFWEGGTKDQPFSLHDILTSSTFAKCLGGAAVGGLAGAMLGAWKKAGKK